FIVSATQSCAAMATDRVNLIDKYDARRVFLSLLKQVAHPRSAHPDKHLHEIGAADAEERHVGLTRDGARQQRLSGSRRPHQQHAFGNPAAELNELLRI